MRTYRFKSDQGDLDIYYSESGEILRATVIGPTLMIPVDCTIHFRRLQETPDHMLTAEESASKRWIQEWFQDLKYFSEERAG